MRFELNKTFAVALVVLAAAFTFNAPRAHAADSKSEKAKIRARSEARDPQVRQLKSAGKIGETSDGLIEAVNPADVDGSISKLIDEENADRTALYKLVAKDQGASIDTVARNAAKINFRDAKKGEWLKENGRWRQK